MLIRYLKPQRNRVIILAILLCTSIGLQLFNPQIVRYFIDTAIQSGLQPTLSPHTLKYPSPVDITQAQLFGAAVVFIVIALVQPRPTCCAVSWRCTVCGWI
jgi:hypothetical protein